MDQIFLQLFRHVLENRLDYVHPAVGTVGPIEVRDIGGGRTHVHLEGLEVSFVFDNGQLIGGWNHKQ